MGSQRGYSGSIAASLVGPKGWPLYTDSTVHKSILSWLQVQSHQNSLNLILMAGYMHVFSGSIIGQGLTDNMDVRKVGFTGSTGIGQTIMKSAAASNVKKVSLELGGKSPLIIFSDCDLDKAVRVGAQSVFFNKGENCIAAGEGEGWVCVCERWEGVWGGGGGELHCCR